MAVISQPLRAPAAAEPATKGTSTKILARSIMAGWLPANFEAAKISSLDPKATAKVATPPAVAPTTFSSTLALAPREWARIATTMAVLSRFMITYFLFVKLLKSF